MTEFRTIDLGGRDIAAPHAPRPRPVLDWLPIRDLIIDTTYQRDLGKHGWARVTRIARHFDWNRFSPCLVAPAEGVPGKWAIIDGQHRTHAARMAGEIEVPCLVTDMARVEQARAFSWVNGEITQMSPMQVYKAALQAREDWALRMEAACSAAGVRLLTYAKPPGAKKPREIMSIGLLRGHIEKGRDAAITAALRGLATSRRGDDRWYWSDTVVAALIGVVVQHPGLSARDIALFLGDHDLQRTSARVEQLLRDPKYVGSSRRKLFAAAVEALMGDWLKGASR